MTDNTKANFSQSVAEFAAWKLLPQNGRPTAPLRWSFSCKPLFDCADAMPEELSIMAGGGTSYAEGSQFIWAQLVEELGKPPSSGWLS